MPAREVEGANGEHDDRSNKSFKEMETSGRRSSMRTQNGPMLTESSPSIGEATVDGGSSGLIEGNLGAQYLEAKCSRSSFVNMSVDLELKADFVAFGGSPNTLAQHDTTIKLLQDAVPTCYHVTEH